MSIQSAIIATVLRDPEIKESKSGSRYANLIAICDGEKDKDGREQSLFVRLLVFSDQVAEAEKLRKGDRLYAEGALNASVYTGGEKPALNLTLKCHYLRKSQIGQHRPRRERETDQGGSPAFLASPSREKPRIVGRDDFAFDALPDWGGRQ